jgi:hypothetical protein
VILAVGGAGDADPPCGEIAEGFEIDGRCRRRQTLRAGRPRSGAGKSADVAERQGNEIMSRLATAGDVEVDLGATQRLAGLLP